MNLYVLLGYLFSLFAATQLLSRQVRNPALQALRAFFPSWKFFDEPGEVPTLLYRVGSTPDALGPWQPCLPKLERRLGSLFVNAQGNLWLAYGSLLQQLLSELDELAESKTPSQAQIRDCSTYRLTEALVALRIRELEGEAPAHCQFKVTTLDAADRDAQSTDVLISLVYPV